ncbi:MULTISPECIES: type II toxin-antitoxin system VapC family toxin [Sulfolobaceae]|uniref:Ribonuclease VapC n=2 Tax=Sulfolobaceae TaxID=118883 RepID=A0A2U9IDC6_9CREN|nr:MULTISPECIES: type II toxin-antitoxin system VapC family toxin [Sulfolobaceae]AWR94016.1 PIN domain-containing protein [Acidianus brierleyi]AWR99351.1 PIN domain-containing protein [Metallosphaera hakonensis JCM 8857 = DSM 7519]
MLIESDVLIAHLKTEDRLKEESEKLLLKIAKGELSVIVSREAIHEIYYVLRNMNLSVQEILDKIGALKSIPNIEWIPTTIDIDLLALALMSQYNITSIFDAYHAATCLIYDKEKAIISTDHIYDKIPGIKRIDPKDIV